MNAPAGDPVTLLINGVTYGGWTEVEIERDLKDMCSKFNLAVSQKWAGQDQPWQIRPFDQCQVMIGGDLALTGYVGSYVPQLGATEAGARVTGRSKTCDLVDCGPDIPSGQYSGYNLGQIARAICALFSIGVTEETDTTTTFADATLQRGETGYRFLERLCRLSGVLATDDENGNLVLTTTGSTNASSALVQGINMLTAHATLSGDKQYSIYVLKGQSGLGVPGGDNWSGLGGGPAGGAGTAATAVKTQLRAVANDPTVPRYRPHVAIAESQLDQAGMQERVNWMARFQPGQATQLHWTVRGFRQADGSLWRINQIVPVQSTYMGIDQDLLVAKVKYKLSEHGSTTEMVLGPPDAYAPDPGEVKQTKAKGKKGKGGGSGQNWSGLGGVG